MSTTRPTAYPSTWRVGDVLITRVDESQTELPLALLLPEATADAVASVRGTPMVQTLVGDARLEEDGLVRLRHGGFVLHTGDLAVLVDTGTGPEHQYGAGKAAGAFLVELAMAGFSQESIDVVICTHVHFDHVGWNTVVEEGVRRPTFPRARYVITEEEWASIKDELPQVPTYGSVEDNVRFLHRAGVLDVVVSGHEIGRGIRLFPLPGHSAGHTGVEVHSGGERALITGDACHHPVQFLVPGWGSGEDLDRDLSRATRELMVEYGTSTGALILGSHFPTTTGGHLVGAGPGLRFVPVMGAC